MNEGPYANGGENTNIYRSMQRTLTTFINSRPFSVLSRPIQYIHDSASVCGEDRAHLVLHVRAGTQQLQSYTQTKPGVETRLIGVYM